MWQWYMRLRHSKGYGVHSPLAFRMLKDAIFLHSDYAYYADRAIKTRARECHADMYNIRLARQLLRLAAFADARKVLLLPPADLIDKMPLWHTALRGARAEMEFINDTRLIDNAGFVWADEADLEISDMKRFIAAPDHLLYLMNVSEEVRRSLFDNLSEGIMFYGKHNLIIFSRRNVMKVKYYINV